MTVGIFALAVPVSSQTVIYVDTDAAGSNDGASWANAFVHLQDALAAAEAGDQVWVAEGIYHPDQGSGFNAGDRSAAFEVSIPLELYGGFAGNETLTHQRNPKQHATILSADLQSNDGATVLRDEPARQDNSVALVLIRPGSVENSFVIDGFELKGAHGAGALFAEGRGSLSNLKLEANYTDRYGGGAEVRDLHGVCPRITGVRFVDNVAAPTTGYGGGLFALCKGGAALDSLHFVGNSAALGGGFYNGTGGIATVTGGYFGQNSGNGGAIYNKGDLDLLNSLVLGNGDSTFWGGGLHQEAESSGLLRVVNSVIAFNRAHVGGGLFVLNSAAEIHNSVLAFNHAIDGGGGIAHHANTESDSVLVANSILWHNTAGVTGPTIQHIGLGDVVPGFRIDTAILSDSVPGSVELDGNILSSDPDFVDPNGPDSIPATPDDDFALAPASPAIDAGDNDLLPEDHHDLDGDGDVVEITPVDILFNRRIFDAGIGNPTVDLGPFEYGAPPVSVGRVENGFRPPRAGSLRIYPNPARARVTVATTDHYSSRAEIVVFDVLGRRRLHADVNGQREGTARLNVSELSRGLYVVALVVDDVIVSNANLIVR